MDATLANTGTEGNIWDGGHRPMKAKYGKIMMWYFLASDALTFSSFLAAYGLQRYKFLDIWPVADDVFTEIPFLHGVEAPMIYTAFMTFLLIFSSVTMVLAVHAGHHMDRKKVTRYMALTILGGVIFIASQAFEWAGFIRGAYGAFETTGGSIVQVYNAEGEHVSLRDIAIPENEARQNLSRDEGTWFMANDDVPEYTLSETKAGFLANEELVLRLPTTDPETHEKIMLNREESLALLNNDVKGVVFGANLTHNEYGLPAFADFFFFITGFHGFHVTCGIILNIIIFINVLLGTYEKRGSYLMVEKSGLYWHFVDLVWVFVFTFFYLV